MSQLHIDIARNSSDDFNLFHDKSRWWRAAGRPKTLRLCSSATHSFFSCRTARSQRPPTEWSPEEPAADTPLLTKGSASSPWWRCVLVQLPGSRYSTLACCLNNILIRQLARGTWNKKRLKFSIHDGTGHLSHLCRPYESHYSACQSYLWYSRTTVN